MEGGNEIHPLCNIINMALDSVLGGFIGNKMTEHEVAKLTFLLCLIFVICAIAWDIKKPL